MATIELSPGRGQRLPRHRGKVAIVDDADFEWLSMFDWHCHWGYAVTSDRGVHMEKLILKVGRDVKVMHRNDDTLDNRRGNLMIGTVSNKCMRGRKANGKTSIYKGVSYRKDRDVWNAHITKDGKTRYLGYFRKEADAAHAYDDAARHLFGQFARLNFPSSNAG